jgi:hypothetical protein
MKKITLFLLSCVLLATACNQSSTNPTVPPATGYTIDSSYYFKINFNGQTLYNYGLKMSDGITSGLIGYAGALISTQNGISTFGISNTGSAINSVYQHANVLPIISTFTKSGNSTGLYLANNFFTAQITDLNTAKIYYMDTTTTANVTSVSVNNVIGTFSGNLIDGTTVIPATGSFCLKKIQ